jgi:hypothetical protein
MNTKRLIFVQKTSLFKNYPVGNMQLKLKSHRTSEHRTQLAEL